jgi:hypothetical protein
MPTETENGFLDRITGFTGGCSGCCEAAQSIAAFRLK